MTAIFDNHCGKIIAAQTYSTMPGIFVLLIRMDGTYASSAVN
jgi:hypothetical protein